MKLARTTHIVTHELSQGSRNSRRITRLVSTRACAWSLEPVAYEDQLRRSRSRGTVKRTFVARFRPDLFQPGSEIQWGPLR
jgi:hypothetical protein